MKVLVTGGAGFIGSNLVDALLERGDEVVVLDNLTTGRRANFDPALSRGAKLVVEDIRDADLVGALLEKEKPEVVFHLAAQIDVRVSTARPRSTPRSTWSGTINMLEAARQAGTRRFVYASTGGAIYGETDVVPTPEDTVIRPEAPYGQAKFAGEGYLGLWNRMHGLSTVSLRFGNVYGPRQDPLGEAGVIAIFCGKLETGGQPTVFGDGQPDARLRVRRGRRARVHDSPATATCTAPSTSAAARRSRSLDLVDALRELGSRAGDAERRPHVRAAVRARAAGRGAALRAGPVALEARRSGSPRTSSSRTACAARCSSSRQEQAAALTESSAD